MRQVLIAVGALVVTGGVLLAGQPATPVTLASVATAMGADKVRTIEYSGSGYSFGYQQAPGPGEPWPMFVADTYKISIDYEVPAMRFESRRAQGESPPRGGGGQPVAGNPRSVQFLSGSSAWSQSASGRVQSNPGAVGGRQQQLWTTPHGLIRAALARNTQVSGRTFTLELNRQRFTVTVGADSLIESVRYTIDNAVLGDVPVHLVYSEYRDVDGVKFPTRIIEKTDGYLTWDITIRDVKPNAVVSIVRPKEVADAPASVTSAPLGPPKVDASQVGTGIWHLIASGYGSTLVEFADFLLMFEAPINDARSLAVIEWARRTVPGKPIRYVVNTHTHFDHAGGLRAYAAEGVTIIAHVMNRSYYENVWERPRTLRPDRLAQQPKAPVWDTMTDKKIVTDGTRSLELYKLVGNGHHPYLLIGYLPTEKMLLYGDMYNPPPGNDPRDPGRTNEFADSLYDNIANRFKLDVGLMLPVHGNAIPFDNLKKAIGLLPVTP